MRVLRIFDVLPFIHAGLVNKRAHLLPPIEDTPDGFRQRYIYVGGASLIWNIMYHEFGRCDMVFCSDRNPTIKKDMLPGYKGDREHNTSVTRSRDAVEYILDDCGFTVLAEDGYEADDLIYSLVRDLKSQYDKIYIYTADSDLYFLVSDTVEILPSSSRAKNVTRQNYTYTAGGSKVEYVPYNTMTFDKIIFGDKSDCIPGVSSSLKEKLLVVRNNKIYQPFLGDKETVMHIMSQYGADAVKQAEYVFPFDLRVTNTFGAGDKLRVAEWGNAFNNKYWRTGSDASDRIKLCVSEMSDMGLVSDI